MGTCPKVEPCRSLWKAPYSFCGKKTRKFEVSTETKKRVSKALAKNHQEPAQPKPFTTYILAQSPLASASPSQTDRKFSYHVSVKLVMTCSAVRPAIFNPRAFSRVLFEADPLRQHHPKRVVDPSHLVRRLAIRNHVAHHRLHRLQYFDLQPASRFPRPSFAPAHIAINVCEFIPSPPIRENLPDELPAGLGRHTILKSIHNLPSGTPVFLFAMGFPNVGPLGSNYLYIVSLTM